MVIYLFVGVVAALVTTRLTVVIVMIYTSVAVVPSSTNPPIPVIVGTLEDVGIPWIFLSLLLGKSELYKSDIIVTIR